MIQKIEKNEAMKKSDRRLYMRGNGLIVEKKQAKNKNKQDVHVAYGPPMTSLATSEAWYEESESGVLFCMCSIQAPLCTLLIALSKWCKKGPVVLV